MFFGPLKYLVFPFVVFFALPLALWAGITTVLAFFVLFVQLSLVYLDVSLETLRYILVGHATHSRYIARRNSLGISPDSSGNTTPIVSPSKYRRRGKPHGNGGSAGSAPLTPTYGFDGFSVVAPSIGFERDFEGVGGWRLGGGDIDAETADDQQWYKLNSRLDKPYRRHHFRSQSGGAIESGFSASGIGRKPDVAAGSHNTDGSSPRLIRTASSFLEGSRLKQPNVGAQLRRLYG